MTPAATRIAQSKVERAKKEARLKREEERKRTQDETLEAGVPGRTGGESGGGDIDADLSAKDPAPIDHGQRYHSNLDGDRPSEGEESGLHEGEALIVNERAGGVSPPSTSGNSMIMGAGVGGSSGGGSGRGGGLSPSRASNSGSRSGIVVTRKTTTPPLIPTTTAISDKENSSSVGLLTKVDEDVAERRLSLLGMAPLEDVLSQKALDLDLEREQSQKRRVRNESHSQRRHLETDHDLPNHPHHTAHQSESNSSDSSEGLNGEEQSGVSGEFTTEKGKDLTKTSRVVTIHRSPRRNSSSLTQPSPGLLTQPSPGPVSTPTSQYTFAPTTSPPPFTSGGSNPKIVTSAISAPTGSSVHITINMSSSQIAPTTHISVIPVNVAGTMTHTVETTFS
jgi:hypothetical protein